MSFLDFEPDHVTQPQPLTICRWNGDIEVILEPVSSPITTEKAERKAATAKRLQLETAKNISNNTELLATHGQWGKARTHDYDGNRNESSIPDRRWSSVRPNENYLNAFVSGRYGVDVDRTADCWDEFEVVSVPAEAFDAEAFNDARAVCDAWKGNHKRYLERKLPPTAVLSSAVAPTDAVVAHSEAQACVWLTQAVADSNRRANAQRSIDSTAAERRSAPVVLKKMTTAFMNQVYWMYLANPEAECGNLAVALLLFAPMKGRWNECNDLLSKAESGIEPDDILAEFATYLIAEIVKGKYSDHDGHMENWIGFQWSKFFFPDFKTAFWLGFNLTTPVSNVAVLDDDDEAQLKSLMPSELFRCDVDREQANRDIENWNSPTNRTARILSDLDDPRTEFGKLDVSTKDIIKRLAKGSNKTQVATDLGISEGEVRRQLKKAQPLREQSFVSAANVGRRPKAVNDAV